MNLFNMRAEGSVCAADCVLDQPHVWLHVPVLFLNSVSVQIGFVYPSWIWFSCTFPVSSVMCFLSASPLCLPLHLLLHCSDCGDLFFQLASLPNGCFSLCFYVRDDPVWNPAGADRLDPKTQRRKSPSKMGETNVLVKPSYVEEE